MSAPHGFLILSDLHLSQGRNPITGHLSRNEDFIFDQELSQFLTHHSDSPHWQGWKWTLIINGDFLDFLQVTDVPANKMNLRSDPRYGLKTGPCESAWKLQRIVEGHEEVFQSLADFAIRHRVVLVHGNHDTEFLHPEVRGALLESLESLAPGHNSARIRNHVSFRPWFFFEKGLYVEHGHQYDRLNSYDCILSPLLPPSPGPAVSQEGDLDLPLGSLFVRYLFNRLEVETPFADNIKPATRFIGWLLRHHPIVAYRFAMTGGREMLRRLKAKSRPFSESGAQVRRQEQLQRLSELAREMAETSSDSDTWQSRLEELDQLRAAPYMRSRGWRSRLIWSLVGPWRTPGLILAATGLLTFGFGFMLIDFVEPFLPGILTPNLPPASGDFAPLLEFFRWAFWCLVGLLLLLFVCLRKHCSTPLRKELRARADRIVRLMDARLVVMGHTHDPDIWPLSDGAEFFNTGTWTKVFSEEERVLREEKELTYLRVIPKENSLDARLLKWEGEHQRARLAYIFQDAE